ncbi:MAG: 1-acyl-sn-glycerol-3-phosphate acyltransferase [Fulvivirga sp.]
MSTIFYQVYKLISANRIIAILLLFVFIGGAVYTSSQLRLEENIMKVMPGDERVTEINKVFNGLKINNRLVFHLYNNDSTTDPDLLIKVAGAFSDSLIAHFPHLIEEVEKEIPDTRIEKMYNYYYSNLPFYLQREDYNKIEERITVGGLQNSLRSAYKQLLSPVGVATKMMIRDPLGLTGFPLQRMREQQLDNNFDLYQNHIVTRDLKHLIFFATLSNPPNETANNGQLIEGINQWIETFEQMYPEVGVEFFGSAAVAVANANRIKADIYLTVTLAVAALFIFISFFYRSPITFFVVITPGVFGAIVAIAFLSLIRETVSVISLGVGSVLLGITIDYALHFFTHFKKQKDLRKLFDDLTVPLLMSSITTACAFLSLIFIRSSALQDLGIFAGVSVIGAVFYTLVFLPHLVPKGQKNQKKTVNTPNFVERTVDKLATYPFYKKVWSMVILFGLTALSLFYWKKVTFESNMLELNYMPEYLEEYQEGINAISTFSANNIYVAYQGADLEEALQANVPLQRELERLEATDSIYDFYTLSSIIPPPALQQERVQQWNNFWSRHGKDSVIRRLEVAAVKQGFREGAFSDFEEILKKPYKAIAADDMEAILSVAGNDLIISNDDGSVSVLSTVALPAANKPAVLQKLAALQGIIILDKGYLTASLVELLREDFARLVNISLLVVFGIILISYGRIELALIAFIPIVLSWLWVLGLMGWLSLSFNIINIIICTFIFGLGIDYSIFVMRGLTQDYAHGAKNLSSYKKSIILSMITTLVGIGVLAFAEHPALQSIAFLAVIGVFSVVFITFTVEHVLYKLFIIDRKKKGLLPYTLKSMALTLVAFLVFLMGCFFLFLARLLCKIPWASNEKRKFAFHKLIMYCCRIVIYMMGNLHKVIVDREKINFAKPAVIISNHHSFIDILLLLMFHPKVVMVTNDWVYHSPLFGKSVQYADFIPASRGLEHQLDKIDHLIRQGYSIMVFPEGTRSKTFEPGRFHKGGFYIAQHFKLDIQPVLLHGTNMAMPRGDDFHLKTCTITVKFLPRIAYDDTAMGEGYSERTKRVSKYFKANYHALREELEIPDFFRMVMMNNYIYKGPVLEWYVRVKYKLEKEYRLFHDLIPKKGRVVDLGCGYGLIAYALSFSAEDRLIHGIDYDEEKILIAQNCPVKPSNVSFEAADVLKAAFGKADVFILSDLLHYLTTPEQGRLLDKITSDLNIGGMIIIRDGDSDKSTRHRGTKLTEVFSTGTGFNKTRNELRYISSRMMKEFAQKNNFKLDIIANSRRTSNTVFVLTQN